MTMPATTREARLRRVANRAGLALYKSRCRTPEAAEFGTYMLVDRATNGLTLGYGWAHGFGVTLDDVEEYLTPAVEAASG